MTPEELELARAAHRRRLALTAPADTDLTVLAVCRRAGHVLEGRVVVDRELEVAVLIGRCQRCGFGFLTDGS